MLVVQLKLVEEILCMPDQTGSETIDCYSVQSSLILKIRAPACLEESRNTTRICHKYIILRG